MIEDNIQEIMSYFRKDKYQIVMGNGSVLLCEKKTEGKTELQCVCQKDAVVFLAPEKNVLPYLKEGEASQCADVFIFMENDGFWDLYIFEFKKTINTATLQKSKDQFRMGIYNARAIAAFVGIGIRDIYLYSGYRKDKIREIPRESLIAMHASNNLDAIQLVREWKNGTCQLWVDQRGMVFKLEKILLDEDGRGQVVLPTSA